MSLHTRAAMFSAAAEGPILAVLCTSERQADGLALNCRGARLERFESNPVLLTTHDHQRMPVGNVLDLAVGANQITGRLVFPEDDPEAQVLERRVRAGVIRALSIGFAVDPDAVDRLGNVSSWELTEVSLVPVPMDVKALVYARSHEPESKPEQVTAADARALLDAAFGKPETVEQRVDRLVERVLREHACRR